jgi:biotin synthase-like enzyme
MTKTKIILSVLVAFLIGTFTMAQRVQPSQQVLSATELDKLAAVPTLEQAILRMAAEKIRQEKRAVTEVELPATIKIITAPNGCHQICVYFGTKVKACSRPCDSME